VLKYLAEENDPTLRAMAKTYADQLSSRLIVHGQPPASLRELEAAVEQAVSTGARPQPRAAAQSAETRDRARSRSRHDEIALEMVGALLDFPALLDEPEVVQVLQVLDGDAALTVAALRRTLDAHATTGPSQAGHEAGEGGAPGVASGRPAVEIGVYADEFLAQIPAPIQEFAVGRLASPAFDSLDVARGVLFENARKLSSLSLKRENAAEIEELHRVEARGDAEAENEMLRAFAERAQKKRGLK
jgi:DNA primase